MKKKILGIIIVLLAVAMLATPVLAVPTKGQKVPITMKWARTSNMLLERNDTKGGISHRSLSQTWTVQLFIDGAEIPLEGTAVVIRETHMRHTKKGGVDQIIIDHYDISFPTEEGGFEGNEHMLLTDYVSGPDGATFDVVLHALFHGTGEFEGQILNAGVDKGPGATMEWEGFILKY